MNLDPRVMNYLKTRGPYGDDPEAEVRLAKLAAQEAAMRDPAYQQGLAAESAANLEAANSQRLLAAVMKGSAMAGSIGGKIADTSAIEETTDINAKAALARNTGLDQQRAQVGENRSAQDKIREYLMGRQDLNTKANIEIEQAKQKAINDREMKLAEIEARKEDRSLDRQNRKELVEMRQGSVAGAPKPLAERRFEEQLRKQELKEEKEQAQLKVYGANPMEGFTPTPKDAQEVKKGRASRDAIMADLQRLDELYAKHGSRAYGDQSTQMEALSRSIQLKLKEVENLGVLNGPDLGLIESMVPNPASLLENAKSAIGQDRYKAKRDFFVNKLEDQFDSGMRAVGYQRTDSRAPMFNERKKNTTAAIQDDARKRLEELRRKSREE